MNEFTPEEIAALTAIVGDWIDEGFTTPPYTDAQYAIFEKLNLAEPEGPNSLYDTRRPAGAK